MRSASRKPLVVSSNVRSPLRSNSALVATVVPIFTAADAARRDWLTFCKAKQVANALDGGVAIGLGVLGQELVATSVPSGRRPTISVNVPPDRSRSPSGFFGVSLLHTCLKRHHQRTEIPTVVHSTAPRNQGMHSGREVLTARNGG